MNLLIFYKTSCWFTNDFQIQILVEVSKTFSQEEILFVSNSIVISKFNVVPLGFSLIFLSSDANTLSDIELLLGPLLPHLSVLLIDYAVSLRECLPFVLLL